MAGGFKAIPDGNAIVDGIDAFDVNIGRLDGKLLGADTTAATAARTATLEGLSPCGLKKIRSKSNGWEDDTGGAWMRRKLMGWGRNIKWIVNEGNSVLGRVEE
jgi:hypothetical protein